MSIIELIKQPWPWYVAGPLIGLVVPVLLLLGNKSFGVSATLRHICAACMPAKIPFFHYDWKKEVWNIVFAAGVFAGAIIAAVFLSNQLPVEVNTKLTEELKNYGITDYTGMVPVQIFNWSNLITLKGFILVIGGGFLVGFGTRYAGGCTSGHSIMGLSDLQWPSLVATCCFMAGGIIAVNFLLPLILN